jgi:hypothetical protein
MDLGLTITLTPEVVARLRQATYGPTTTATSTTDESKQSTRLEDDREATLPLNDSPYLPVLWIDVTRLVGYMTTTRDERHALHQHLCRALYGDDDSKPSCRDIAFTGVSNDVSMCNARLYSIPQCQAFEQRVQEMWDHGMARHDELPSLVVLIPTTNVNDDDENDNNSLSWTMGMEGPYMAMPYPRMVIDASGQEILETAHVWHTLCQSHHVSVVDRVLLYLRQCNRSLGWKYAIRHELIEMVASALPSPTEDSAVQWEEWNAWRTERRPAQLEQLYQVRETLVHRCELAQQWWSQLQDERDAQVAAVVRQRRIESGTLVGLEALDLNATVFSFPVYNSNTTQGVMDTNLLLGLRGDNDDECDEYADDYSRLSGYNGSDYSGSDAADNAVDDGSQQLDISHNDDDHLEALVPSSPVIMLNHHHINKQEVQLDLDHTAEAPTDIVNSNTNIVPTSTSKSTTAKERRRVAAQRRRHRLVETAKESRHQAQLEAAMQEEEALRESMTTTEMKLAQVMVEALTKRLEQVDVLLESLQEEVWQEEEEEADDECLDDNEQILGSDEKEEKEADDAVEIPDVGQFSLLDQILAMIFGSTSPSPGKSIEEHYIWLKSEHESIVKDWKEYFGSLPTLHNDNEREAMVEPETRETEQQSANLTTEQVNMLKVDLGIYDNEVDDWERSDE